MDLEINKKENDKFHVKVWRFSKFDVTIWREHGNFTYSELEYVEMNNWCIKTLHYHARTSYHMFEFKSESDLTWCKLRWS